MQHNAKFLFFTCMPYLSLYAIVTSDVIVVQLVVPIVAFTNVLDYVSVVMISKTGRAAQSWNKRETFSQTHLRKHLHLTNCIHLNHHLHMQKIKRKVDLGHPPELFKELSALQKSRSLRDPSASPSWNSPSVGSLLKKYDRETEKEVLTHHAAVDDDESRTLKRIVSIAENLSANADRQSTNHPRAVREVGELNKREVLVEIRPDYSKQKAVRSRSGRSSKEGTRYAMQHHGIVGKVRDAKTNLEGGMSEFKGDKIASHANDNMIWSSQRLTTQKNVLGKLKGCSDMPSKRAGQELGGGKPVKEESSSRHRVEVGSNETDRERSPFGSDSTGQSKPWNREIAAYRKHKTRKGKILHMQSSVRMKKEIDSSYTGLTTYSQDHQSWKSSAFMNQANASALGGNDELEISELPHNGCGIPWNWSRIHSRGKDILDLAGRSLSCGASGRVTRKLGNTCAQGSSGESMLSTTSEFSDVSPNTDSESLPLLDPAPPFEIGRLSEQGLGEQSRQNEPESSGIHPKNQEQWFSEQRMFVVGSADRPRSLTQKYMPKSFHDIVGQHLVTQALSNALSRGRVAPVYIFYGPRGTGKTSCARVFGTALNCLSSEGKRPCGSCRECLAHNFGKSSIIKEVNAGGKLTVRGIKALMQDVAWSSSSLYKVYIVDECHALSNQAWNAFLKVVDEAPRNVVFILSTSNLEQLPHTVVSKCQKFLFSKIKESEIINRLQQLAVQEGISVDAGALKLIASACDGSLRDAEMMLDQLSLLGQKISLSMVQELMGLISDDKLVELLDFALSADTVNTVRSLRELVESGVEPLNLMSQLACLITSILAGGYQFPKEEQRRKFFRKKELTKEDMEWLRQALKTLSEAEKQLRGSSDRITWLTAALLQLAPDQSYLVPSSSADTSVTHSPVGLNDVNETPELKPLPQKQTDFRQQNTRSRAGTADDSTAIRTSDSFHISASNTRRRHSTSSQSLQRSFGSRAAPKIASENGHCKASSSTQYDDFGETSACQATIKDHAELEEVWQRVLDAVHSNSLRKFLQTQGKLLSLSLFKGSAVAFLEFSQLEHTARAERSRASISHAFQVTLGCRVEITVHLASKTEEQVMQEANSESLSGKPVNLWQPTWMPGDGKTYSEPIDGEANTEHGLRIRGVRPRTSQSLEVFGTVPSHPAKSQSITERTNQSFEIVALDTSGRAGKLPTNYSYEENLESAWVRGASRYDFTGSTVQSDKPQETIGTRSHSTGKSRVSLGFVIQQAEGSVEGYSQDLQFEHMNEGLNKKHLGQAPEFVFRTGQDEPSAMAMKLEEENLSLESRSGGLLCWKSTEKGHEKVKQAQQSPRRPGFLSSLFPCAKSNRP